MSRIVCYARFQLCRAAVTARLLFLLAAIPGLRLHWREVRRGRLHLRTLEALSLVPWRDRGAALRQRWHSQMLAAVALLLCLGILCCLGWVLPLYLYLAVALLGSVVLLLRCELRPRRSASSLSALEHLAYTGLVVVAMGRLLSSLALLGTWSLSWHFLAALR